MAAEYRFRLCPIEIDGLDMRMRLQKIGKVVGYDGRFDNIRIQTAGARAGLQHIPHGDAFAFEFRAALFVGQACGYAKHGFHEGPEAIVRVGVIAPCREGGLAWHRTQHQPGGPNVGNGRKTVDLRHDAPLPRAKRATTW